MLKKYLGNIYAEMASGDTSATTFFHETLCGIYIANPYATIKTGADILTYFDLEDITEQSQQIATFAADLSHTAEAYIKTPLLGRAHLPKMPLAPELCLGKPTKPIQARPWTLAA